jgi:MerR family transcriptional regulator/heat shock protein HspR
VGAESLDDEDVPALTTGQAAEFLGVQPAFLRSLDAGRMVCPARSAGGHRRYTRRQLTLAARIRELFDEGLTLTAAAMVVTLQDEVALVTRERDQAHDELDRARRELVRVRRELAAARGGSTAFPVPSARGHIARGPEVPTTALRPPLPAPPPQRTP